MTYILDYLNIIKMKTSSNCHHIFCSFTSNVLACVTETGLFCGCSITWVWTGIIIAGSTPAKYAIRWIKQLLIHTTNKGQRICTSLQGQNVNKSNRTSLFIYCFLSLTYWKWKEKLCLRNVCSNIVWPTVPICIFNSSVDCFHIAHPEVSNSTVAVFLSSYEFCDFMIRNKYDLDL